MMSDSNDKFIYETVRLRFRGLAPSDIDGPYAHWLDDQEVCRYSRHGNFPSTRGKLKAYIDMLQSTETQLVWAIVEKERNIHIGNIALQDVNLERRSADLTIMLGDKSCWGLGYSEEAARIMLLHGFRNIGLNRVTCGTSKNNSSMKKLAAKLGMKQEGIRREALFEEGKFVDMIEFGVLEREFNAELTE